jgi:hypothetical protein
LGFENVAKYATGDLGYIVEIAPFGDPGASPHKDRGRHPQRHSLRPARRPRAGTGDHLPYGWQGSGDRSRDHGPLSLASLSGGPDPARTRNRSARGATTGGAARRRPGTILLEIDRQATPLRRWASRLRSTVAVARPPRGWPVPPMTAPAAPRTRPDISPRAAAPDNLACPKPLDGGDCMKSPTLPPCARHSAVADYDHRFSSQSRRDPADAP